MSSALGRIAIVASGVPAESADGVDLPEQPAHPRRERRVVLPVGAADVGPPEVAGDGVGERRQGDGLARRRRRSTGGCGPPAASGASVVHVVAGVGADAAPQRLVGAADARGRRSARPSWRGDGELRRRRRPRRCRRTARAVAPCATSRPSPGTAGSSATAGAARRRAARRGRRASAPASCTGTRASGSWSPTAAAHGVELGDADQLAGRASRASVVARRRAGRLVGSSSSSTLRAQQRRRRRSARRRRATAPMRLPVTSARELLHAPGASPRARGRGRRRRGRSASCRVAPTLTSVGPHRQLVEPRGRQAHAVGGRRRQRLQPVDAGQLLLDRRDRGRQVARSARRRRRPCSVASRERSAVGSRWRMRRRSRGPAGRPPSPRRGRRRGGRRCRGRRSCSGPAGVAATVSRNRRRERCAACTICRHGSLTVNGSTAAGRGAGAGSPGRRRRRRRPTPSTTASDDRHADEPGDDAGGRAEQDPPRQDRLGRGRRPEAVAERHRPGIYWDARSAIGSHPSVWSPGWRGRPA